MRAQPDRPRTLRPNLAGWLIAILILGISSEAPAAARSPVAAGTASRASRELTPTIPIEEIVLDNGFRLLLVDRPNQATVEAGWVVETGSLDDPEGAAGMSHLLEHLLFKGTKTIGTRDYESERKLLDQEDRLVEQIAALESSGGRRQKLAGRRRELDEVRGKATALARLGELSLLYSEAGGTGLNAHTFKDFALHLVTLPAEKLELWFWLESDRLHELVLREFSAEAGIINEERRQRIESRPGGPQDEAFERLFWGTSRYAHRPLGRPSELASITRASAMGFFRRWFRPDRLTAVLVGPLDRARVRELAETYFGRLRGQEDPASTSLRDSTTTHTQVEAVELGPREPWRTRCECARQLRVLYPAVPFGHADSYPLQILSGLLNGRSGRLHLDLVVEREFASAAASWFQGYRLAGLFGLTVEAKGVHRPKDLLTAWDEQVAKIRETPPSPFEVSRVQAELAANAFRRLREPGNLRTQLLVYAGLGRWREISNGPVALLQVSPADVQRVARAYLARGKRTVAYYESGSP